MKTTTTAIENAVENGTIVGQRLFIPYEQDLLMEYADAARAVLEIVSTMDECPNRIILTDVALFYVRCIAALVDDDIHKRP